MVDEWLVHSFLLPRSAILFRHPEAKLDKDISSKCSLAYIVILLRHLSLSLAAVFTLSVLFSVTIDSDVIHVVLN